MDVDTDHKDNAKETDKLLPIFEEFINQKRAEQKAAIKKEIGQTFKEIQIFMQDLYDDEDEGEKYSNCVYNIKDVMKELKDKVFKILDQ